MLNCFSEQIEHTCKSCVWFQASRKPALDCSLNDMMWAFYQMSYLVLFYAILGYTQRLLMQPIYSVIKSIQSIL